MRSANASGVDVTSAATGRPRGAPIVSNQSAAPPAQRNSSSPDHVASAVTTAASDEPLQRRSIADHVVVVAVGGDARVRLGTMLVSRFLFEPAAQDAPFI